MGLDVLLMVVGLDGEWSAHLYWWASTKGRLPLLCDNGAPLRVVFSTRVAEPLLEGNLHSAVLPKRLDVRVAIDIVERVSGEDAFEKTTSRGDTVFGSGVESRQPGLEIPIGEVVLEQPSLGALGELLIDL